MRLHIFNPGPQPGRGSPLSPVNTGQPAADDGWFPSPPDTGCELSPSCLTCTLPVCKYDLKPEIPIPKHNHDIDDQRAQIIFEERLTTKEAAQRFNVTERTVFRILERARNHHKYSSSGATRN